MSSTTSGGGSSWLSGLAGPRTVIAYLRNPCGNCKRELHHLTETASADSNQSYFILISDSDPDMIFQLADEFGLTCPLLYDYQSGYRDRIGIWTFPFNIVVNDSLGIEDIIAGYIRSDEFREIAMMNASNRR